MVDPGARESRYRTGDSGSTAMLCPNDDDLAKYAERALPAEASSGVERHLSSCQACSVLVGEFARLRANDVKGTPLGLATTVPIQGATTLPPRLATTASAPLRATPFEALPLGAYAGGAGAEPGVVAGRFELIGLLGEGGMGRVYSAFDRSLGRKIALKLLRPGSAQGTLLAEARSMARLSHPNVVGIYDAVDDGGRLAIAMELVEGETLAQHLARKRPPWAEALSLYVQAGQGLVAAHAAGLVHRDFKPQNVLVDREGRVRVTDFGLALLVAPGGAPAEFAGTPAYMAPEQLLGRSAGRESDQFAFCIALYEAVYGTPPFTGATVKDRLWATMQGAPPPPPGSTVPPWVFEALRRGLAPRPEARYGSMRALLDGLEGAAVRAAERHVHANVALLAMMAAFQLAMTTFGAVAWKLGMDHSSGPSEPSLGGHGGPKGLFTWGAAGVVLVVALYAIGSVLTGWGPVGAAWALSNAYGLARRKPWARASTLAYGAVSTLTCCGAPYGLYALYSLTRPGVRALLGGQKQTR